VHQDGIERVAAELEIRNLLARLAQLADSGETDKYLDLLTDDVTWTMPANPIIGLPASELHGQAEIATGQKQRLAAGHQGPGSNSLHMVTTSSVHVDGDRASAYSYFQFWTTTLTKPTLSLVGRYDDEFGRTPTGWKLTRRTITFG
jgi:3-phenylpropionate/cinnamic acid dioxygenase small subunit